MISRPSGRSEKLNETKPPLTVYKTLLCVHISTLIFCKKKSQKNLIFSNKKKSLKKRAGASARACDAYYDFCAMCVRVRFESVSIYLRSSADIPYWR